jgi:hypothetical protein
MKYLDSASADGDLENASDEPSSQITTSQAGASAQLQYDARRRRREQQINRRWGRLAAVVKRFAREPQSTRAWAKGSAGERLLAARLERKLGGQAALLHDLRMPRGRGNIDHIVVAASGVWVIDTKCWGGRVERRDVGGMFKTEIRLRVAGRDRTNVVEGARRQAAAVQAIVAGSGAPVRAVLCFVQADWKLLARPFKLDDVWITWPTRLVRAIAEPGALSPEQVSAIAQSIADVLPPAAAASS